MTATATPTRPIAPTALPQPPQPYRLSLDQYHRMAEAGILTTQDRIELLDGFLVHKMTRHPPHVTAVQLAQAALRPIVPADFHIAKEDPLALPGGPWGGDSEPEPDVMVVRGAIQDFADHHPGPADVPLVVEVADSSLDTDRNKITRYAWAGIPAAWLVNLQSRTVELYTDPTGPADDPRYRNVRTLGENETLAVTLAGRDCGAIAVRDVLP